MQPLVGICYAHAAFVAALETLTVLQSWRMIGQEEIGRVTSTHPRAPSSLLGDDDAQQERKRDSVEPGGGAQGSRADEAE